MLEVTGLTAAYGPVVALSGVEMKVPDGAIVAVLGANGAGKSTLMRAISGLIRPAAGRIEYDGHHLDRLPPERIVRAGVVQVPEGRQLFTGLTVLENLRLGAYARPDRRHVNDDIERVFGYFPVLRTRSGETAGALSGGEGQMLAIARALMARPKLLLLDEPSTGLAPRVVEEIFDIVASLNRDAGLTVLVAEQDVETALDVAQTAYVLETGRVVAAGTSQDLRADERIRGAYLGLADVAAG
jgi:branched-chain amino acid transport system ATP-binding protein